MHVRSKPVSARRMAIWRAESHTFSGNAAPRHGRGSTSRHLSGRYARRMAAHVLAFERPVVELVSRVRELRDLASTDARWAPELERLEEKAAHLAREVFANLSPMQKVQLSRHPNRPYTLDYVARLFSDFFELKGDRRYSDDASIVAGLGRFHGRSVAVVG